MTGLTFFVLDILSFLEQNSVYRNIALRDRLMVGHIPLEDVILVRIQVPQFKRSEKCGIWMRTVKGVGKTVVFP